MDPISLAIAGVGLGMQIFGAFSGASHAKEAAAISQDEARQEQGINEQKQKQMELEGRRMQLENVRNNQRARAAAIATSSAQTGNNRGSGLAGGLAQINDQTLFNMQGVNQAQEIGHNIFGYNNAISADKIRMASVQASQATDQGIMSLGGAVMKAGPIVGQLSQGFGNSQVGMFSNGGNDGRAPRWV